MSEKGKLEEFLEDTEKIKADDILVSLRSLAEQTVAHKKEILSEIDRSLEESKRLNALDKPILHANEKRRLEALKEQRTREIENIYQTGVEKIQRDYDDALNAWATVDAKTAHESIFTTGLKLNEHDLMKVLDSSGGDYTLQRLCMQYASDNDITLMTSKTVDIKKKSETFATLAESYGDVIKAIDNTILDEMRESDLHQDLGDIGETIALG